MRNGITGRALWILMVLMLAPTAAWAVHPFQVEDTDTQGKGNYLFEVNDDQLKAGSSKTTTETAIITAGISEFTDIALEVPYLMLNPSPITGTDASGMGDLRLKLKYKLNENEVKQSSGFQFYTDLPTGDVDKGLGKNNVVMGVTFMDQQECHSNVLHVSAGYEVYARDVKRWHYAENYAVTFGFAAEHKFTESFRFLTELAGEIRKELLDPATGSQLDQRPFTFMAGFKYDISRSWYIDLAARAGLNKYAADQAVLMGTAWRF